jgi:exodeoxyribonuclease-3
MKLYSWNVNGIRAVIKKGAFKEFTDLHQPDILCLQETKAKQGQATPDLPDYLELWNSADKAGYSGTAIFTRTEPITVLRDLPTAIAERFQLENDRFGNPNREGRALAAEFDQFWLLTVYTPNSKNDLSRLDLRYHYWDPAFLTYTRGLEAGEYGSGKAKPVVFCGDLNVAHQDIDLARPNQNHRTHGFTDEERERFQDYLDHGFIDTFRVLHPEETGAYTWWNLMSNARARNVGWRIDYFVMSGILKSNLASASIHPEVTGSDHCPVSIELTGL